jgi:sporulation protein YlmC with PRC-barrel domain
VEERGLVGLEARAADGAEIGRIAEVVTDEETGEVTHVVVELMDSVGSREELEDMIEVPISALTLDPEADYATFEADPFDDEPGDHLGDEVAPEGYAPAQSDGPEDYEHENQLVTTPSDPDDSVPPEDLVKESGEAGDWQDEEFASSDSGYPRNDVYIDPDTGEEELDPLLEDNETLADDVEDLLAETGLEVRHAEDGVVELSGSASTQEALEGAIEEIMGLDEVREVDATDVDIVG